MYDLLSEDPKLTVTVTLTRHSNRVHFFFQALLFNVNKPFSLGSGSFLTTEELMVDCFVSSFRINYRNNQHFDICFQPNSPAIYHLAYVKGTYSIVKEVKNSIDGLSSDR